MIRLRTMSSWPEGRVITGLPTAIGIGWRAGRRPWGWGMRRRREMWILPDLRGDVWGGKERQCDVWPHQAFLAQKCRLWVCDDFFARWARHRCSLDCISPLPLPCSIPIPSASSPCPIPVLREIFSMLRDWLSRAIPCMSSWFMRRAVGVVSVVSRPYRLQVASQLAEAVDSIYAVSRGCKDYHRRRFQWLCRLASLAVSLWAPPY